jgi:Homeodomain-like domain
MCHIVRAVTAIQLVLAARRDVLLEVLALHHQLAVLARSNRRFRTPDRLLWLFLRRVWPQWRDALRLVQPATVDRWHRDGFDRHWWRRSRRPGRPRIDSQIRDLIRRLADENRLWGAPRIHGELLKLGIVVSERTVSRYLHERPRTPSQTWRTFLANHVGQIAYISKFPSPDASGDDVVDALLGRGAQPHRRTGDVRLRNARWSNRPAAVRRPGVGGHFTQEHLRDRTGMRRSTGRSPPRMPGRWLFDAPRPVLRPVGSGRAPPRLCETIRLHLATSRSPVASLCLGHSTRQHDRSDAGPRVCVIDSHAGGNTGEAHRKRFEDCVTHAVLVLNVRDRAKQREGPPLTVDAVLPRRKRHVPTAPAATLPDGEADQLSPWSGPSSNWSSASASFPGALPLSLAKILTVI